MVQKRTTTTAKITIIETSRPMAKRRALKPPAQIRAEREEKAKQDYLLLKEQGVNTAEAVHRIRKKYRVCRTTAYKWLRAVNSAHGETSKASS